MTLTLQDLTAILGPILGLGGPLIGFMWHHSNGRMDKLERSFNGRMDKLEVSFNGRMDKLEVSFNTKFDNMDRKIDTVEQRLSEKIDTVEQRLGEKIDNVRDRVSRVEGQLVSDKVRLFEGGWPMQAAEKENVKKY